MKSTSPIKSTATIPTSGSLLKVLLYKPMRWWQKSMGSDGIALGYQNINGKNQPHTYPKSMKKIKTHTMICAVVLVLAGLAGFVALADNQSDPFTPQTVTGSGCPGSTTGYAKMTNSAGGSWITPPTNATSATFTDASGFAAPYVSVVKVVRKSDQKPWCDTNSVTFPVTNSAQYSFTVYVKSPLPPPTNGEPMNLQIIWQ